MAQWVALFFWEGGSGREAGKFHGNSLWKLVWGLGLEVELVPSALNACLELLRLPEYKGT